MSQSAVRKFYFNVYRLAQESVEALALFAAIQNWFKTDGWAKDFDNAVTNEDLLRIVAMNSRRSAIVTLHILCDDGRQGKRGYNIYKLVRRIEEVGQVEAPRILEAINQHAQTIKKIGIQRHNSDAHYNESDDWKQDLGGGLQSQEVNRLLSDIFAALLECGKTIGVRQMPFENVFKVAFGYGERLIRALSEQVKAGTVGPRLESVREWEEQDRQEQSEETGEPIEG